MSGTLWYKVVEPVAGAAIYMACTPKIREKYCNVLFLQRLEQELVSQNTVVDELEPLLAALTAELPPGEAELETLRDKLEAMKKAFSNIADALRKHRSNLEAALPLAKAFEEAECKLYPWVGTSIERLEGLGALPAEAHQVQKLKFELEVS